jgi:type VI secretion system secreted protein VgrG
MMASRDGNNFLHILEAPGVIENYKLFRMEGEERISAPFRFRLTLRSQGDIPPASAWVNASITFSLGQADKAERKINGRCASFRHIYQKGSYVEFAIEVAPAFEALTLNRDRRIFTDTSAKQVVEQVLGEHSIAFDSGGYGQSPKRAYIVQQDESDFDLVTRLMGEEGVFYFFKYDEGAAPYKHRMVLANSTSGYYDGAPFELSFRRDHLLRGIHNIEMGYASSPAAVLTHDYDFTEPGKLSPINAPSKLDWAAKQGHVYQWAPGYADPGAGKDSANLHIEGQESGAVAMHGTGSYAAFAPGARFQVPDERLNPHERRIVVRAVSHSAFDPYGRDEGEPSYRQNFEAQPSTQIFRPERAAPPASAKGPQTAIVVDQTDPQGFGRIKVKFHWDRTGASTCWVRVVQAWAGNKMGAQFVPRPGMEVLVDFIDGRSDRPVVVGCLYNGKNEHSYAVPANLTQAGFRTYGDGGLAHELIFEDKGGSEEIYMASGRDYRREVMKNETATIGETQHVQAKNVETKVIETVKVDIGKTMALHAAQDIVISSDASITLKVGGSQILINGGGIWVDGTKINLNSGAPSALSLPTSIPAVGLRGGPAPGIAASAGGAAGQSGADSPEQSSANHATGNPVQPATSAQSGPSGKAPPVPMGIDKTLGADAAALAAKSPALTKDMDTLAKDGWSTQFGPAGGGTSANRATKIISIDKNEAGKPAALVQSLAHEVGHASYQPSIDMSSKPAFLRSTLADEGAATLSNVKARREILANRGADIGIAGNPANQAAYNSAYDAFLKDGDAAKARNTIGSIYGSGERTSTTGQTYADYYGGWYDKNAPHP